MYVRSVLTVEMAQTAQTAQEITLTVPANFSLPRTFSVGDMDITATALRLGAFAYEAVVREGKSMDNAALLSQLREEATRTYKPMIQTLEEQVEKNDMLLSTMRNRLKRQEEELLAIEARVREEERRNREEIVNEKTRQIDELRQHLRDTVGGVGATVKESSRVLTDSFQRLGEQILKGTGGSSTKGKVGERQFAELLRTAFGAVGAGEEFDVEEVGTEGHQGDIHMKWRGHLVMWETKNYSKTISGEEVKKFLRDMEQNPQVALGIMVGLHTGIVGHTHAGGFDIQELRDGRVCLYITNFSSHEDGLAVLQGLQPFFETFLRRRAHDSAKAVGAIDGALNATAELEGRLGRIEANRAILQRLLQNHVETMRKYKNSVLNAKKKSDAIWADVLAGVKDADHGVKLLLDTLLADETPEQEERVKHAELASYVFKQVEWSFYNEREQKFLKDTLELFEFGEEFTVPAKAVKDAYKTLKYSDDAVNAMRSVFLDSAWEKGKKEVKGMRLKGLGLQGQ